MKIADVFKTTQLVSGRASVCLTSKLSLSTAKVFPLERMKLELHLKRQVRCREGVIPHWDNIVTEVSEHPRSKQQQVLERRAPT